MSTSTFESQSLNDWLFHLEQQHPVEIDLGLERVGRVAALANVTDLNAKKTVLVAGTNGKGTTIRFIEQALLSLGLTVGVFSSPHLFTYHERVRINGQLLTDQEHVDSFDFIEKHRGDTALTYFEFSTLSAFRIFQQKQLDVVLVEVGLGGRLDSTNILNQDVSVITSIDLDHTDWLGDSKEQIAFEKAGIFKPSNKVVVGEPTYYDSIEQQAVRHNVASLKQAGRHYSIELAGENADSTWAYSNDAITFNGLQHNYVPTQNIATAITVMLELGIDVSSALINSTIERFTLDGRMQVLCDAPLQLVDVAHNPHAVTYLSTAISTRRPFCDATSVIAVVAMMKDKDIKGTLQLIAPKIKTWHLAAMPNNPRAAKPQHIKRILEELGAYDIHIHADVQQAWLSAQETQHDQDLLLGFGSFYTVADILHTR